MSPKEKENMGKINTRQYLMMKKLLTFIGTAKQNHTLSTCKSSKENLKVMSLLCYWSHLNPLKCPYFDKY